MSHSWDCDPYRARQQAQRDAEKDHEYFGYSRERYHEAAFECDEDREAYRRAYGGAFERAEEEDREQRRRENEEAYRRAESEEARACEYYAMRDSVEAEAAAAEATEIEAATNQPEEPPDDF